MTVTYKGLDCLADQDDPKYMDYYDISQSGKLAWGYQATYAKWCLYFGVVMLFLAIVRKLWYMYSDWSYRNGKLGKSTMNFKMLEKISALSRYCSYRRIPLTVSRITGLPATLGTLIVLTATAVFLLCVCFIPHYYIRPCAGFGSPPLSVRSGMMTMAMLPFLMAMSGKTNFISFVTGVSYEKLNVFHQCLAWGTFFLAMVHTVPFLIQPVREGGMSNLHETFFGEEIYINGIPPLVFLFCLCFLSTRFARSLYYEIWFHSHWVLGLAYIGTLTWHVYGCLGSEQYVWGTIAVCGFQSLYRALVKTTFKPNEYAFKSKEAKLQLLPANVFEVSVSINGPHELHWKPGQHIFIRFISGLHTLDNHPFSILTTSSTNERNTLKLLVKPQRGLTRTLYETLQDDKRTNAIRCLIDGPYGGMNRDPLAFDKLILISTGTGVSVTLPFLSYIAEHLNTVTNCVQNVEFIWVVRSVESIQWIKEELQNALTKAVESELAAVFDVKIFVTGSHDGAVPEVVSSRGELLMSPVGEPLESKESVEEMVSVDDMIKVYAGVKPNLQSLLEESTLAAKTAVICSGTASSQIACGNAVGQLQKQVLSGKVQEVYLHTENFGW